MASEIAEIEIVIGIFDIVCSTLLLGLTGKILRKYLIHKDRSLLSVGLTFVFASFTWLSGAISFFSHVVFGVPFEKHAYLFISQGFLFLALIMWIYSFCLLFYPLWTKRLVTAFSMIGIAYEIGFTVLLVTQDELLGTFSADYFLQVGIYVALFITFTCATVLVTVIIYLRESVRTQDKKVILKAKILLVAILSLGFALILEKVIFITIPGIIVGRIIAISSVFEFYLGFFMPKKFAQLFIRSP